MGLCAGVEGYLEFYSSIVCDMPMLHKYIAPVLLRCIQEGAVTMFQVRGWLKAEGRGGADFKKGATDKSTVKDMQPSELILTSTSGWRRRSSLPSENFLCKL